MAATTCQGLEIELGKCQIYRYSKTLPSAADPNDNCGLLAAYIVEVGSETNLRGIF
jgi:hypothetical protein